jgi:hypothetical protein
MRPGYAHQAVWVVVVPTANHVFERCRQRVPQRAGQRAVLACPVNFIVERNGTGLIFLEPRGASLSRLRLVECPGDRITI